MSVRKPKTLFYVVVKDVRTRPKYKSKMMTVYANGVPTSLAGFTSWLKKTIDEKVEGEK